MQDSKRRFRCNWFPCSFMQDLKLWGMIKTCSVFQQISLITLKGVSLHDDLMYQDYELGFPTALKFIRFFTCVVFRELTVVTNVGRAGLTIRMDSCASRTRIVLVNTVIPRTRRASSWQDEAMLAVFLISLITAPFLCK